MREPQDLERAEAAARRLMRVGCDDEEIAARTGLSMLHLLAVRASAAVEASPKRSVSPTA